MSRKKGQGKNTFDSKPLHLMFRFAKGEHSWAHFEVGIWREIFKRAASAPKDELRLFRSDLPKPHPGTVFLMNGEQTAGREKIPLSYFAVQRTKKLLEVLKLSLRSNDGSALRELADAIESPQEEILDPLRWWLVTKFFDLSKKEPVQIRTASMRELKAELDLVLDVKYDRRHIKRACVEMGIKLDEKAGRPRKV